MAGDTERDAPFNQAIEAARAELRRLKEERAVIDSRIKRLTESLAALSRLTLGEDVGNVIGMGLTDAIRAALAATHPRPLTSGMVVAALEAIGYDLSEYKNKQGSVNGTLQRLADGGELRKQFVFVNRIKTLAYGYRNRPDPELVAALNLPVKVGKEGKDE